LVYDIHDESGQMTFRKPVLKRRRKEIGDVPVAFYKVDFHCAELLFLFALIVNDYNILRTISHWKRGVRLYKIQGASPTGCWAPVE